MCGVLACDQGAWPEPKDRPGCWETWLLARQCLPLMCESTKEHVSIGKLSDNNLKFTNKAKWGET